MTDLTLESSQGPAEEGEGFVSIAEQLSIVGDAIEPFVKILGALPKDIRHQPDRNLADILGVFTADMPVQLTVADLIRLGIAYALVSPNGEANLAFAAEEAEQRCRACGLTGIETYIDPLTKAPFKWIEPDLCSGCAGEAAAS